MVKFGKKFFFNNTYIKKNRTITIISIVTVILLIVTTFFITSQFYNNNSKTPQSVVETYKEIDIKLFDELPYMLTYFKKLENTKISDIKVTYPDNLSYTEDVINCSEEQIKIINAIKNGEKTEANINEAFSCVTYKTNIAGHFNVKITIGKNDYYTTLNVVDSEAPKLVAKDVEIYEDEYYSVNDFIDSCTDNSLKECKISFLNTSLVDYSKYKEPGTYSIKIIATDDSGNKSEAAIVNLTIKEIIYYTVKFDTSGGSAIESQNVREGKTINYPSYPSRDGYIFEGWYYNNKEFDMNTPINSDMTIVAKWKKMQTSSGGGTSGGGSSGGGTSGGGTTSNTCIKYSEVYANVSIYNYQLLGSSKNDCMPTSGNTEAASSLAAQYQQKAIDYYRDIYAYGKYCNVKSSASVNGVKYRGKHAGYLIKYTITSDCAQSREFTLSCTSKNDCNVW